MVHGRAVDQRLEYDHDDRDRVTAASDEGEGDEVEDLFRLLAEVKRNHPEVRERIASKQSELYYT